MTHELFNFGVAGRRDFAVRDQLQPNAAGSAWVKNVPMLRSNFPKTESHERNPTYSIFRGLPRALCNQQSASKLSAHNSAAQEMLFAALDLVGSCVQFSPDVMEQ